MGSAGGIYHLRPGLEPPWIRCLAPCTDTLELPGQIDVPRHWCKGETKNLLFLPVGARTGAAFLGTYRKKIMGWGVQIPVPEMVRTMMGTWPSAWHEHQEQAEQDTTCGARLRRCQRFPQHPHPLLQGALVALPRKEFFLGRGVYSVASSLASPCSAHTRRTWRLSVLFAPMATCERRLLQEAVCVLPLPPPLLPQRW